MILIPHLHPPLPHLPSSQVCQSSWNLSLNQSQTHSLRHCLHHRCLHCASSFFSANKQVNIEDCWDNFCLLLTNNYSNETTLTFLGSGISSLTLSFSASSFTLSPSVAAALSVMVKLLSSCGTVYYQ